jgi:hypothetical protein
LQHPHVLQNLSRILYTFCKVRSEKVIVGLLNNEPRWIEPLLAVFNGEHLPWEENYILLLWLSHLMLSPFDLATISSFAAKDDGVGLVLPDDTPGIASQVLQIGLRHLGAATIERKAASSLLVRLCIRQDMLNLGLLSIVTRWAIVQFEKAAAEPQIHSCLGMLTFLSGLVASSDQKMLGPFLASVFRLSQRVLEEESLNAIRGSAIARKLVIKIQRNTVIHCLQGEQHEIDTTEVVEQVIGALIELLADSDTPVRMAASKALSLVTLKLDPEMAGEVIEAINASFHEELIGDDAKNFWSVNAAKWHGIVLTLGHLLHRRALSAEQVPEVLRSILYALNFEQRSTTGKSVGSNVRDAANYGLWAVARRFTTKELESISANSFSVHDESYTSSAIQYIALNLLVSACFDPDGNVRRGSSAALQELIGRHPNTIVEGIALVQVVDYQAVGLRARAATKDAHAAARLDKLYEKALVAGLFTWRGLAAASLANRSDSAVFAGIMVARISNGEIEFHDAFHDLQTVAATVEGLFSNIRRRLSQLKARDHEERQGLLLTASWILSALNCRLLDAVPSAAGGSAILARYNDVLLCNDALSIPEFAYILSDDFNPRAHRCEMVVSATLRLFGQLAEFIRLLQTLEPNFNCHWNKESHFKLLSKCLSRRDDIVLEQVPGAIGLSMPLLPSADAEVLVQQWLVDLLPENKRPGISSNARILALGATFNELRSSASGVKEGTRLTILQFLLDRYLQADTEARIVILQSLKLILCRFSFLTASDSTLPRRAQDLVIIAVVLLLALHDYTISERGDVGSLVRLAGLAALQEGWSHGLFLQGDMAKTASNTPGLLGSLQLDTYATDVSLTEHLKASVLRLSLEKLDKVRLAAVECWRNRVADSEPAFHPTNLTLDKHLDLSSVITDDDISYLFNQGAPLPPKIPPNYDVSSESYFYHFLALLGRPEIEGYIKLRILEGFCSTAGGAGSGASQTLLNARQALHLFLTQSDGRSVMAFVPVLKNVIDINAKLENDQRLVPILEVAAFALDMGLLQSINTAAPANGVQGDVPKWS